MSELYPKLPERKISIRIEYLTGLRDHLADTTVNELIVSNIGLDICNALEKDGADNAIAIMISLN